jgi:tetratricopeptide (TPR) repeat protein
LTLLTTAESRLARELSARPALALELRVAIAKAYRNRGEFERTRSTLRQAIAEAEQALPADDPRLARAWIEIADWQLLGDKDVGPALDRAIATARQMGERGAELLVDGLHKRAQRRLIWEGRLGDSLTDVREAHSIAVKHLGPGHPTTLTATARLSDWLAEDDAMAERLALTEQAYAAALANAELGASDPRLLEIQGAHAINLVNSGRGREGLDLLRAAAKTARQYHGGGLPAEIALTNLFEGLVATGDAAGALEAAQQAYALAAARETAGGFNRAIRADMVVHAALISRRVEAAPPMLTEFASHSNNNSWADSKRVWLMSFTGDTVGAARFAPVAIESATRAKWSWHAISARLGWSYALRQDGHPDEADRVLQPLAQEKELISWSEFSDILKERAAVKLALGDAAQALSLIDAAIRRKAVSKLQTDPYLSDLYLTRGQALLQLGRANEALEAFRIAADFWGSYDADSHWSAEASYWLARALIETGDPATGRPMLKAVQPRLAKSPMPSHRALATSAAPPR